MAMSTSHHVFNFLKCLVAEAQFLQWFCSLLIDLWNISFYTAFCLFLSEMFVLHCVFASEFQKGKFLRCFWGETAATCFLQWFLRSFYSTEKLSFTKSFSCFCDLYVLKCSFYNMFLRNTFLKCRFYLMFLAF